MLRTSGSVDGSCVGGGEPGDGFAGGSETRDSE